ncbi:hypothetical protein QJQ45_022847, partial [Haematococcus lacustris]
TVATVAQRNCRASRLTHTCYFQHPAKHLSLNEHPEFTDESPVLLAAERDLEEYCGSATDGEEACEAVKDWLVNKWHDAEEHVELGPGSATATTFDQLQTTVRELASTGSTATMYRTLRLLKKLEQQRSATTAENPSQASSKTEGSPAPWTASPSPSLLSIDEQAQLAQLFQRMDKDKNGELSWAEFNNAMHAIGDDLTEDELQLVSNTLDLQGHVTLDQFLAIVAEAEASRATPQADALFLRHVAQSSRGIAGPH